MSRILLVALVGLVGASLAGCVQARCCPDRVVCEPERVMEAEVKPLLPRNWALYDGASGKEAKLAAELADWADADLVAFGELHNDPVGAKAELAVLEALHAQGKPLALAMEFIERDAQPAVDAYLKGDLAPFDFVKQARQSKNFANTHGPLLKFCKENGIPVIAANAPRRLVSAYRKQEQDYEAWKASLPEADRAWLPEETTIVEDEYQERFVKLMGGERGATFFRSQSLWDDAMAEAMTDFREEHPNHRILFIVGAFHVQGGLGTLTKYMMRRGRDEIRVLTMTMDKDETLPFAERDRGLGDLVLKVPYPKRQKATGPNPHKRAPKKGKSATPSPDEKPDT